MIDDALPAGWQVKLTVTDPKVFLATSRDVLESALGAMQQAADEHLSDPSDTTRFALEQARGVCGIFGVEASIVEAT